MDRTVKKIISYSLPAIIVLILDCIILGVQGIWPLGSETIDYYDMGQQVVSEYYQIYDELHGTKSMFIDWYTSLGCGIYGGTNIAITSLLLYFFPRNMILEYFSVAFIFKTMCMALTMRIFLKKAVKECPDYFSVLFSAGYGLCGFVLMNYTIIGWLDITIIVPLVMMYTQRLLKEGKMTGYIVTVALTFLLGFYVPSSILIFIFLMSGVYVISERFCKSSNSNSDLVSEVSRRSPYIIRLGIATILALALSSFSWAPKVFKAATSQRFEKQAHLGISGQYMSILKSVFFSDDCRWWCLLGASFAATIVFLGIYIDSKKKNYKRLTFVVSACLFLLLQLFFENVLLFWHFGSYVGYPVRDGFWMYLALATAAAVYIKEVMEADLYEGMSLKIKDIPQRNIENKDDGKNRIITIILGTVIMLVLTCVSVLWYKKNPGMTLYLIVCVSLMTAIGTFLCYLILIAYKNGRYIKMSAFLFAFEMIFYGVLFIGKPTYITGYAEAFEQDGEYVRIANQLKEQMDIKPSNVDRIKNPDTSLNANYGNVLERSTLSGWPCDLSGDVLSSAISMGYSNHYTRLLDAGGNAFSDAILHITQVLTINSLDDTLYELKEEATVETDHVSHTMREYGLYDCKYVLPFGTIIRDEDLIEAIKKANNSVDFANAVYDAINNNYEKSIDKIAQTEDVDLSYGDNYINVSGNKLLYFTGNCANSEYKDLKFSVNDESVPISSIKEEDNDLYPAHFNNNSVYLGSFCDEEVKLTIESSIGQNFGRITRYNMMLYSIDLDMFDAVCDYYKGRTADWKFSEEKNLLDMNLTAKEGEYLMLPLEYSSDWRIKVNGTKVAPVMVTGLLMAIPLLEGSNEIRISFLPYSMQVGFVISAITILVILINIIFRIDSRSFSKEAMLDRVACVVYTMLFSIAVLAMYVVPIVYAIVDIVKVFIC